MSSRFTPKGRDPPYQGLLQRYPDSIGLATSFAAVAWRSSDSELYRRWRTRTDEDERIHGRLGVYRGPAGGLRPAPWLDRTAALRGERRSQAEVRTVMEIR